ncbi:hypothetical protein [Halobacteriovorax marinus]|uniref:hypothetical protein n=1 Tax=Halobacteriovorax marinus TaxID=97084 RepID=UPI003A917E85
MKLEEKILETLSFFNPMTLEQIYLDFDEDFLLENSNYTYEDLISALTRLEKCGKLKSSGKEKSKTWIRVYPKKGLLSRLLGYLK